MMLASELASAACIAASFGMPCSGSIHASAATSTRPPPMPSRPARMPATTPSTGNIHTPSKPHLDVVSIYRDVQPAWV